MEVCRSSFRFFYTILALGKIIKKEKKHVDSLICIDTWQENLQMATLSLVTKQHLFFIITTWFVPLLTQFSLFTPYFYPQHLPQPRSTWLLFQLYEMSFKAQILHDSQGNFHIPVTHSYNGQANFFMPLLSFSSAL